jgi:hypothetical protein
MTFSSRSRYRILDEPLPGQLARFSTDPFWVVLALMLCGGMIGWPWFIVNALAIGSATKVREISLCVLSVALLAGYVLLLDFGYDAHWFGDRAVPYLLIGVPALKMSIGFIVYRIQARSFALYTYFGGSVTRRAGFLVLLAFAGRFSMDTHASLWKLVLS